MRNFYKRNIKMNTIDITISAIFVSLYIIFGIFPIRIPGVMRIGLDFIILAIIGLILGPYKGILVCMIGDFITTLINGIMLWMWQYSLINMGVVLLSSLFLYIIVNNNKFFTLINVLISICIFASFYLTFIIISIVPNTYKLSSFIKITVIFISVITLIVYLLLWKDYIRNKRTSTKNVITFFSLSSIISIIFSWIFGTFAFIAYMNRLNAHSGQSYNLNSFQIFLVPRIIKSFFTIPIYTFLIYRVYHLIHNQLKYKNWLKERD